MIIFKIYILLGLISLFGTTNKKRFDKSMKKSAKGQRAEEIFGYRGAKIFYIIIGIFCIVFGIAGLIFKL